MSRIEMAMEKAAALRQGASNGPETKGADAVAPETPVAPPTAPTPIEFGTLVPEHPFLVNLRDPHSPSAEEYRKLKSLVVKLATGDTFRNCLMVTSSVPCEGKSLTALNLALTLAQDLDHTVLLVDADLRRPSVHQYLNLEQGAGLSEVLTGKAQLGDVILPTGIGRLSIIRGGAPIDNPVELFSSQRAKSVVAELKNRYPDRFIIFDTPPVLPFAEARSLAHVVDGVLFVVMERLATQANVVEALEILKGAPVLGTVFNAATIAANDGRYAYYRGYYGKKA